MNFDADIREMMRFLIYWLTQKCQWVHNSWDDKLGQRHV